MNQKAPIYKLVIAGLAFIFAVLALKGTGNEALLWGAGLMLMGVPVYLYQRFKP